MAIKYTNIFHCKTLQNLPKLGLFLVWEYAIWQPCVLVAEGPAVGWLFCCTRIQMQIRQSENMEQSNSMWSKGFFRRNFWDEKNCSIWCKE
jgi:hypothetical protein